MMNYKTVYPENRRDTGLEFEADSDTDAIDFIGEMYPAYEKIKATGGDVAAFIRPLTGVIIVLVRDEAELTA